MIYGNHRAVKWLRWNSNKSLSAQFRARSTATHISALADSILTASDDKKWKAGVSQTLKSPLLQFPHRSAVPPKKRGEKGLLMYVVSSKFAMGGKEKDSEFPLKLIN